MTAGDPLHPGIVFGGLGTRYDLELNAPLPTATPTQSRARHGSDWTQPLVFSKADPHALYYANQFLFRTTDGAQTWTPDQPRPDAPRSGRAAEPRFQFPRRTPIATAKRGVIYAIGPSPLNAPADLGRHRRWAHSSDDRRRQDLAERHAAGDYVMEPRHRDRRIACRRSRGVRRRRSTSALRLRSSHLPHARPGQDAGRKSPAGCLPTATCTSSRKIPFDAGCCLPGPSAALFVSFDDGDNWQSLQLNLPVTSVRDFEVYGNDLIVGNAWPRFLGDRRHQPAASGQRRDRARRRLSCSNRRTPS